MYEKIVNRISQSSRKAITYAEYIEAVLYDQQDGYYMKPIQKLGKNGDFYTSSNIGPIFGATFFPVFQEIFEKEQLEKHICEIGAGNGDFAYAFLSEIRNRNYDEHITYSIVETSPYHRNIQRKRLEAFPQVTIYNSVEEMQHDYLSFEGIIFSNELIDAFPVHVVELHENLLYEVLVTLSERGDLEEKIAICNNPDILRWVETYGPTLTNHQRLEVPLAMNHWIDEIARWMNKGVIFTIDYGYTKNEWQEPARKEGSLRGYYQHQFISNPLCHPGEMDLTTHIHFDAFIQRGNEAGLEFRMMTTQDKFLLAAGILNFLQDNVDSDPFSQKSKRNRAIRTLLSLDGISRSFHVIVQSKQCDIQYTFLENK